MTARKTNLQDPIYHDDDAARAHLEALLWPHGPVCPRCGVIDERITKLQGKCTRPGVYKCKDCRKPFTVTVGTVMERSHVPLHKWVLAAHFMAVQQEGHERPATATHARHELRDGLVPVPSPARSRDVGSMRRPAGRRRQDRRSRRDLHRRQGEEQARQQAQRRRTSAARASKPSHAGRA